MANTKVTTGVIKDDAVGADQLASNSVVTASIVDNAITTAKINNDAILTAKISNSAITNAKMSANSVDSDQYVDASIDTAHIRDGQITSAKLDTNISVSGELTVGSHLNMGDGDILKMGAGNDLQIYHDGSNSVVADLGTGDLRLLGNNLKLAKSDNSENYLHATADGAVQIYYAGSVKIATTSSGVDITGTANVGSVSSGSASAASEIIATSLDNGTSFGSNRMLKLIGTSTTDNSRMGIHFTGNTGIGNGLGIIEAVNEDQSAGHTSLRMHTYSGSWNENNLVLKSGKVGIGTDSPSSELHIKGASPAGIFNSQLLVDTTDTTGAEDTGSKILFGYHDGANNRSGPYIFGANTSGQSGHYSAYLAFGTRENGSNPTERMRINSSGNILIGGTTGTTTGGSAARWINLDTPSSNTYSSGLIYKINGAIKSYHYVENDFLIHQTVSGVGQRFFAGTSEAMRINTSGDVILAANATGAALIKGVSGDQTNRNVGGYPQFTFVGNEGTGMRRPVTNVLAFDTSGDERMLIDASGNVEIGGSTNTGSLKIINTSSDVLILDRRGSDGTVVLFRNDDTNVGGISVSGSSVVYSTSSDYRLKENIKPLKNGLEKVQQLNPVKFDWKETGETNEGFIAHEVQEICKEAVVGEKDGEEMQGVDYGRITPLLVKAIQEQQAQIEILKTEIQELKE